MNFTWMDEAPGLLAGDVGDGAERGVTVDVTLRRSGDAVEVRPTFHFTVRDAVDFCPGDCGADVEQHHTLAMSRWEASGIARSVAFVVRFAVAPDRSFTVPCQSRDLRQIAHQIAERYVYIAREGRSHPGHIEGLVQLAREFTDLARRVTEIEPTPSVALLRDELLREGRLSEPAVAQIFELAGLQP
jgi:hypothetical protein